MDSKRHHFIIADDDHELRFFVRRILLKEFPEADVSEAATSEEALELYNAEGADLMVIDHMIPVLSGTDLIRTLRKCNATIPLVMASNHPDAKEQAMTAGATCFLDKSTLNRNLAYYLPALVPKRK
jgi:two-component system, OmpR family, response regulator RegX3